MKHTRTQLKNGLRIITVPMTTNQTVTVMVLVETGSKYETHANNGISHFLEHLCFKGTEKRTVFEITEELDGLGAESNAFTSEEYTGYYAKAHKKHVGTLVDVVSDIYLNATLPADEIQKERGVIIEEINMYEDMPHRMVWDVLEKLLYTDQPAGMTVLGTKENILKLSRKDFVKYRTQHYVAEATTVIVSGNINEEKVIGMLSDAFAHIPTSKKHTKKPVKDIQKKPELALRYRKTDQAHLVVACRSFDYYDKRNHALRVMGTILGQGMSSRLFKIMRDERGMCYYVRATPATYTDAGYFSVSAGVNKQRLEEALEVILEQMKKLTTDLVQAKELVKAKEFIIGTKALGLESSSDLAEWFGFQELHHDKLVDITHFNAEIQKVTAEDIQNVARDIFTDERLNLAVVGPFKNDKTLRKILSFT